MTDNTEDRILTQVELAKRWGLNVRTLQLWHANGKGPARIRFGNKFSYRLSDVLKYEEENREAPGTGTKKRVATEKFLQAGAEGRERKRKQQEKTQ